MSAYFDHHIASIKPEIMRDIDRVIDYFDKTGNEGIDWVVLDSVQRIAIYLRDYRKAEQEADEREKLEDIKNDLVV